MSETRAFGSWPSPLTAADVTAATPRIDGARFVGDEVWWGEGVPEEGGRTAVRRRGADGAIDDVLPAPWNARSRVHEYGGGSWTTTDEGTLLFVEKADQCVWALEPGAEPRTLTPAEHGMRFGGLTWQNGELLAIREAHDGSQVPHRSIVRIALDGSGVTAIVDESDFLAQPALSPSGRHIAWIAWNHPDMPWDRSELRVGRLEAGIVVEWTAVAGEGSAPLQPVWIDDDDLLYADDSTGRWNLWREHLSADLERHAVAPADADTGGPLWVLGTRWFGRLDDGRIVAVRTNGDDELVLIDTDGTVTPLPASVTTEVCVEDVQGTRVLVSGASADSPSALWAIDVDHPEAAELIHGGPPEWGSEWMPRPRAVTFDGPTGPVHAFDYPPTNPDVAGSRGRAAPVSRLRARRADHAPRGCGVGAHRVLHESRHRRSGRQLRRFQRLRACLPRTAARAMGGRRRAGCRDRRVGARGHRSRRRRSADDRRRLRGRLDGAGALVGTDVFTAGISRYGVGDARALADRHARLRGALPGWIDRPAAGRREAVHRAVAAVASRAVPRSAAAPAGRRGPGRAAGAVRGHP